MTGFLNRMATRRWLHAKAEALRFRYLPGIANRLLDWTTRQACRALADDCPQILVDSNVLHHAVTHETIWIDTEPKMFGGVLQEGMGYMARVPIHRRKSEVAEYSEIQFLPGIAHLYRRNRLALCTSAELIAERESHPPTRFRATGMYDHSLFGREELESVDGDHWDGLILSTFSVTETPRKAQQERLSASKDPLYLALLKVLGPTNSQDAWHIRTAEVHGMMCFLTMDKSLVRAMKAQARNPVIRSLKTRVMTPSELGSHLGILPFPPILLSYTDASYPVRADLTQSGEKRRAAKPPKQ